MQIQQIAGRQVAGSDTFRGRHFHFKGREPAGAGVPYRGGASSSSTLWAAGAGTGTVCASKGCTMGFEPLTRMKQGEIGMFPSFQLGKAQPSPCRQQDSQGRGHIQLPPRNPTRPTRLLRFGSKLWLCDSHPESIFRQKNRQAGELCLPAFGPGSPD